MLNALLGCRRPDDYMLVSRMLLVSAIASILMTSKSEAASFDCTKAKLRVEHLICASNQISNLDSELSQTYQEVLGKANSEAKQRLKAEQVHWLTKTRNVCESVTCLKHAYWSRQAALKAWYEPRASLYVHESEKAKDVRRILAMAPLYYSQGPDKDRNRFCTQIFKDLKEMNGIRFIDPVFQTQSYEDPELDPWKTNCQSNPPYNFTAACVGGVPKEKDAQLRLCEVSYGLPPFKLYELPPSATSKQKHFIFYDDSSFGPMNWDRKPYIGGGYPGFREINPSKCETVYKGVSSSISSRDSRSANYNSIIEYEGSYYFLILRKYNGSDWLEINSADERKLNCRWAPVRRK